MTKIRLAIQTAVYGILAAIYMSLFFFGALYPEFGLPSNSIVTEADEDEDEESEETEKVVVYKSFLLERLKEWF